MLVPRPALLLGDVDQLQSDGVLLPPVAVVDIEDHHGQIIIVVIFLYGNCCIATANTAAGSE